MNNKDKANELAKLMLERQALKDGVKLPLKFWSERAWQPKYRYQVILANSLLKNYDYEAIKKALDTYRGKVILSLKAPWLDELIELEQKKLNNQREMLKLKIEERKKNDIIDEPKQDGPKKFGSQPKTDMFDTLE